MLSNIRLWKIVSTSTLEQFKDFILDNLVDIANSDSKIECAKHLSYLEYIPKISLKDLEYADTDLCVIEFVENENPEIFEVEQILMKEGVCDWCRDRKILRYFCPCKDVGYCTEQCRERDFNFHSNRCKRSFQIQEDSLKLSSSSRKGLVGLQNLGNTCFMNTSLQCMSNCYELTQYFLSDYYKDHINVDNPIGTQGNLCRAYSNLLKNIWFGSSGVYSPWNFKSAIATFQSMFTGYQQHDTQEFLNYLLDGLHEDLNKVLKKPLVEKDDSNKLDTIKAKEQWRGFLRRNQSVLVDLLYGQYKSTLYCPDPQCQNISTTFDPFLSVSLPLASKGEKYDVICYFIFHDITLSPIQLNLNFYTETTVIALRNKIAKLLDIHPFSFMILKMDNFGDLDMLVNSSMLVKMNAARYIHKNQVPFFCFQIDPEIYYSRQNNLFDNLDMTQLRAFDNILEELEKLKKEKKYLYQADYEEDEKGATKDDVCYYSRFNLKNYTTPKPALMKINTDNNNGLDKNWVRIIINLRKYDEDYRKARKRLIFPRIIYINKQWSTKQVHLTILKIFSSILKKYHNVQSDDIWDTFFPDLESTFPENGNMSYEDHRAKAYPYVLRLKPVLDEQESNCVFCQQNECEGCLLPCSDTITVRNLFDRIPKNENMEIDNSYYYLNERQKEIINLKERDFILELTWLDQYLTSVRNLNDKRDFEIQSSKSYKEESIDIGSCFKNFVKLEKLQENNEWFCPQCKQHQKADKKMEIYKSPHILIIHLKRFRNHSKIDNVVDFPINGLDISNYVIYKEEGIPLIYDLFAIANHYGGLGGGHYVAYAKNYLDNQWYSFNDSSVSRISEEQLVSSGAYVLFYRRRDLTKFVNLEEIYKKPFEDFEKEIMNESFKNIDLSNK